jgi:hypothetical protein
MNKKILIGLGVLAVAGIGYYMWKKKSETKSSACGCSGADGECDDYSNAVAAKPKRKLKEGFSWCCAEYGNDNKCRMWEQRPQGSRCGGAERVASTPIVSKATVIKRFA